MKDSDKQFLKLFHNNLVGLMISDEDHIIVDVNEHLLQLIGVRSTDVIGKTGLELNILDAEFVKKHWHALNTIGNVVNQELSFNFKNTKKIDVLFSTEKIELDNKIYWLTTVVDITKTKKTEEALSNIYERVTDAFVAIDKNWCYTYVNKKAGELLEKEPDYLVGKNIWTEFPEDIDQPVYVAYHKAMETQQMIAMEEYYEPYGRWFQNLIYPSADGLSVFFSDITERKKSEEKIRESELRFRTLSKTAPVGIFETDSDGLTTYVNETWMEYSGLTFEEAIGDGWLEAVHPDDRKRLAEGWYEKTEVDAESISEYRISNKEGRLRWLNGRAVPVIDNEGRTTGYIGVVLDVTERKNAEERIINSEESKRLILNSALDAVIIVDTSSVISFWNPQAEKIFGWSAEEVTGKSLTDTIIPVTEGDKHNKGMQHYLQTGHGPILNRLIETAAVSKYGILFPIELSILPIEGEKEKSFCAFIRDITERKKSEGAMQESAIQSRELSRHLQEAREDERMHIAREIHDELGQQLTGLKMDIAWLMKKLGQEDQAIKSKFDDALVLVDSTVRAIRRIATELRPSIIDDLGLNAAMEWLVAEFTERLSVEIEYENNFDDKNVAPEIAIGLFRILQESLTNIAKHASANKITISLIKERNAIRLSTEDNGIGFDSVAKPNQLTFGLLGIKERTHMLKGEYAIFTKPGKGTKIEVRIPL